MKKTILLILLLPMMASAQYFDVFDIDTSEYPIMKAKFYSIDANGKQILNHTPADFEITENGEPRDVISVSCPEPNYEPVSIVIAVDVSGSMKGVDNRKTKEAIESFINKIPNYGTEVAIIAFNDFNHYISDFTSNKEKLISKLNGLLPNGDTDFDAAFLNPFSSAFYAMESAKYNKKCIILITDGFASGNEIEIINKAKESNIIIYSILTNSTTPDIINRITIETGGQLINNLTKQNEYNDAFLRVFYNFKKSSCILSWTGTVDCELNKLLKITDLITISDFRKSYTIFNKNIESLLIEPNFINFGEIDLSGKIDTTITINALDKDFIIEDLVFQPNDSVFQIMNNIPILVKKGEATKLNIRFTPKDSVKYYSILNILTNFCNKSIGIYGWNKKDSISQKTLELLKPNGKEVYFGGTDTTINWTGITYNENVELEYSLDNGQNWSNIIKSTNSLEYLWKLPNVNSDSCLVKISQLAEGHAFGAIEWSRTYGGDSRDYINSIIQTNDGGYVAAGWTDSFNGDIENRNTNFYSDYWILKLDSKGAIEWSKTYGGSKGDLAFDIKQTFDNGYIVVGEINSNDGDIPFKRGYTDTWVLKLDSKGAIEWSKTYGGLDYESFYTVQQTDEGGFLLGGKSKSYEGDLNGSKGGFNAWLLKLRPKGDIEWSKTFEGSRDDEITSIQKVFDGGYILTIITSSYDYDFTTNSLGLRLRYIKIDSDGNVQWEGGYDNRETRYANSVIETLDGGFLIVGFEFMVGGLPNDRGGNDAFVLKLDYSGNVEWYKYYGGSGFDQATDVCQLNNGNYVVAGITNSSNRDLESNKGKGKSDYWLIKLSPEGKILNSKTYGGSEDDEVQTMSLTNDGGLILGGTTKSNDYDVLKKYDEINAWVVKLTSPVPPLQSDTSDAVFSIIMPQPVIQNNDIDMGQMIVGNTKDTIVSSVICNTGDAPLHVLGVDITGGDDIDFLIPRGAGDFYLEKDQCQDMMFEFTPSALGNRTAVATIRTTIGDFTDTINIRGVGIDPLIEATTDVVDFGQFELGDGKDTTVVLVKNVGSDDITITETKITGPDIEQFDMVPLPSFTLSSDEDKELELNYTAKYGGRTSSIIEFHYDGVGSPFRSMLFAEGIGGEVYPQVPDAYVGDIVELGLHLGRIKPEGLDEVATNFTATVSYNSTLLAPIDKNMSVTTENTTSFIEIEGQLSGVSQIATVPMKVGLGTAVSSGLVVTEFQLYDANGDSVDYEIEPGVGEFNVLGICEEGGTRLVNPNGEKVGLKVAQDQMNTNATVSLNLIESGQTDLIIYDQLGNVIETAYSGTPSTGAKELSLDLSNYTNGRYYIKLTTPTITKTEIIEVVR